MTKREKEIKEKIAAECYQKGWRSDYNTACSIECDFVRCPDDFECLQDYLAKFKAVCVDINNERSCKECWESFLKGDIHEKN